MYLRYAERQGWKTEILDAVGADVSLDVTIGAMGINYAMPRHSFELLAEALPLEGYSPTLVLLKDGFLRVFLAPLPPRLSDSR